MAYTDRIITKDEIRKAFDIGLFKLNVEPDGGDIICCVPYEDPQEWFYFNDFCTDGMTVDEYMNQVTMDEVIDGVFDTIEGFRDEDEPIEWEVLRYLIDENCKEVK